LKKITLVFSVLLLTFCLLTVAQADPKGTRISLGSIMVLGGPTGSAGMAAVGFGLNDSARIDAGVGSLSFTQGANSPVSICGIFYYNFNPRSQNVMHATGGVTITFNGACGNNNTATLFSVGGGIGWECFVNRDFSVSADINLASVVFGGGSTTFSVLQPSLSAHYYL